MQLTGDRFDFMPVRDKAGVETDSEQDRDQQLGERRGIGIRRQLATLDRSVDYVGLGPIFSTGTKLDAAPALGETTFATLRRRLSPPVVAIGGLTAANAAAAIAAGADGIAVVSAICAAADPRAAARALRTAVDRALAARTAGRMA